MYIYLLLNRTELNNENKVVVSSIFLFQCVLSFYVETRTAAKITRLILLRRCIVKKEKACLQSEPTCLVMCSRWGYVLPLMCWANYSYRYLNCGKTWKYSQSECRSEKPLYIRRYNIQPYGCFHHVPYVCRGIDLFGHCVFYGIIYNSYARENSIDSWNT